MVNDGSGHRGGRLGFGMLGTSWSVRRSQVPGRRSKEQKGVSSMWNGDGEVWVCVGVGRGRRRTCRRGRVGWGCKSKWVARWSLLVVACGRLSPRLSPSWSWDWLVPCTLDVGTLGILWVMAVWRWFTLGGEASSQAWYRRNAQFCNVPWRGALIAEPYYQVPKKWEQQAGLPAVVENSNPLCRYRVTKYSTCATVLLGYLRHACRGMRKKYTYLPTLIAACQGCPPRFLLMVGRPLLSEENPWK